VGLENVYEQQESGAWGWRVRLVNEGGSGEGGGIQFDTTPQAGGFLQVTTTSGNLNLDVEGSGNLNLVADGSGDVSVYAAEGSVNIEGNEGVIIVGDGDTGIGLDAKGDGDLQLTASGTNDIRLVAFSSSGRHIVLQGIPTSDPAEAGAIWNSAGTLKISLG
jgi:hypothetical protein